MVKQKRNFIIARALCYLALAVAALLFILPFVQTVLASLKPATEIYLPHWIPKKWAFENYAYVFEETVLVRAFFNTLLFILPPVLLGAFSSALCAYGFARLRFPGKNLIFTLMMLTLVIPNIIILVPSYVMFADFYRWSGTPLPVIVPGIFGSTLCMFFIMQFIRMMPRDVEEAARIDGLGWGAVFIYIVLPLCMPAVVTQLILGFNGLYNDYLTPLLYLGSSRELYTVQLAINSLNQPYVRETEKLLAACIVALMPTLVLFFSAQKYFIEGIAVTGLK